MKGERHALCVQVEQDRSTLAVVDSFVQAEIIALDNSDPVARIKLSNTIGCNPWVARVRLVYGVRRYAAAYSCLEYSTKAFDGAARRT